MKINLISTDVEIFKKQLSSNWKTDGYEFFFNSQEDIVWDSVIVYENINQYYHLKCRKGGFFFISGEPPIVKVYSRSFLTLFDHVISAHKLKHLNNHRDQQALPWYFGYNFREKSSSFSYEEIEQMDVPLKRKKISFITSTRTFLPGHKDRLRFLKRIRSEFGDDVDFYGRGINIVDDKASALLQYKFSICIENSCINDYWTEKIADPFLAYTVPIYYGCKNIKRYFPENSVRLIDIQDVKGAIDEIGAIIANADSIYNEMLPSIKESRNRLLFVYNIFPFVIAYINKYIDISSKEIVEKEITPYVMYPVNIVDDMLLRMKRILLKRF
ncbi:glycosyltransferase family 10 domain-containing protein [Parabacteroides gordonii]|uniref:glycosyltransferase family 10 domain-containing protein n=1 Tax=Parabacteroides gordonii TaxID=574930 RepID=UPI0026F3410A|nr:glycosyltransferase family 10 [Parabacteroides gordonii]